MHFSQCARDFRMVLLFALLIDQCEIALYCSLHIPIFPIALSQLNGTYRKERREKTPDYYCAQRNYVIYCNFANINIYINAGPVVGGGCTPHHYVYRRQCMLFSYPSTYRLISGAGARTQTHTWISANRVWSFAIWKHMHSPMLAINDLQVNNFAH